MAKCRKARRRKPQAAKCRARCFSDACVRDSAQESAQRDRTACCSVSRVTCGGRWRRQRAVGFKASDCSCAGRGRRAQKQRVPPYARARTAGLHTMHAPHGASARRRAAAREAPYEPHAAQNRAAAHAHLAGRAAGCATRPPLHAAATAQAEATRVLLSKTQEALSGAAGLPRYRGGGSGPPKEAGPAKRTAVFDQNRNQNRKRAWFGFDFCCA